MPSTRTPSGPGRSRVAGADPRRAAVSDRPAGAPRRPVPPPRRPSGGYGQYQDNPYRPRRVGRGAPAKPTRRLWVFLVVMCLAFGAVVVRLGAVQLTSARPFVDLG